jgi:uncharacterized membrane protein YkgB
VATIHTKLGREKNMKQNIGNTDRIIRVVLAVLLAVGAWMAGFGSVGGIILLVLAAVMLVTSAVGFCPLYAPFGFTTKPRVAKS